MSELHDCAGDPAAYVLGALSPAEVEVFRRHLETCTICQDEVENLKLLSDALPLAAPQSTAPKSLRKRVMTEVRADAKLRQQASRAPSRRTLSVFSAPAIGFALVLALVAFAVVKIATVPASTHVYRASIGDAKLRVTNGRGELVVNHLSQPALGDVYEVWLKRGSASPAPTHALFSTTSHGQGDVDVPGNLQGVSEVLVTQQPANQTQVPAGRPLIVAKL
jgi:hypothetical protein